MEKETGLRLMSLADHNLQRAQDSEQAVGDGTNEKAELLCARFGMT